MTSAAATEQSSNAYAYTPAEHRSLSPNDPLVMTAQPKQVAKSEVAYKSTQLLQDLVNWFQDLLKTRALVSNDAMT